MITRNPFGNGPTGKGESIAWVIFAGIMTTVLLVLLVAQWISLFGFVVLMIVPALGGFIGAIGVAVFSDEQNEIETAVEME